MCIGALIGGGIDLAVQLASNGGDVQKVNWVQVGVSAAVGATGVGLGGVIANATKSVVVNVALNTAASAAVSAVGAEVQNVTQEAGSPGIAVELPICSGGSLGPQSPLPHWEAK
jgi:hypothetical protein